MTEDRSTPATTRDDLPTLSRRQLLAALGGAAVAAGGYGYGVRGGAGLTPGGGGDASDSPASPAHVETLTALAEAIYPPSMAVDESWIENRVFGRVEPQAGHFDQLVAAVEAVDTHARARFGGPVTALSPDHRRGVLHSLGATEVHPTADGTTAERVRFYLLGDLLYVLLTAPESSDLTGIANPPGHPGGTDVYTQGPGGESQ
ncbi:MULTISPECIES: hypothetical protein [Haloarcula]|uniref:hypothetical protein n=1 Tax=Haloarcula TaxID=2237 RepID=UPI0023EC539E|nr:hypothetical protein [Halomicroarcula sp. XH51]